MSNRLIYIVASNRWDSPWQHALDLAREMKGRGWSVTAYTRDARVVNDRFRSAGIDMRFNCMRGFFDATSIWQLAQDLRHESPGAIVHCQRYRDAYTVLVARKLARRPDIRVVTTRHRMEKARDTITLHRVYRNVHAHIFVSNACAQTFLSTWSHKQLPFPAERVHIFHSAVNMEGIEPVSEPERGPKIAMYHGLLASGHGLETLVDAMALVRGHKLRLQIVGSGDTDYIDTLRRRAQMRGVMDLIDWQLRAGYEAQTSVAGAHFGVLPYTSAVALGISNIEYMASGRPQIYTGAGAPPEYIRDNVDGIEVKMFDSSGLATAMIKMAENADMRRRMGHNAHRRYQTELSWPSFADHIEQLYRSL